jgi:alpha-glucosidase
MVAYYGEGGSGVHMPFNFQLVTTRWDAQTIGAAVESYEAALPDYGWPNWVLGNHDNSRIASRVGRDQARVAAMMLLTLRGTPTMYYGDEVGMCDVPIPTDRVQDPFEKNVPGMGLGRDPERTPMQWDASPGAGFTAPGVEPWLPLSDDYADCSVAAQRDARDSFLSLYRALIQLRRDEPALHVGNYALITLPDDVGELIAYVRHDVGRERRRFLVVLNLSDRPQTFAPPDQSAPPLQGRVVLSTHMDRAGETAAGRLALRANEGFIIELTPTM